MDASAKPGLSRSTVAVAAIAIVAGAASLWFSWHMERTQALREAYRKVAACGHPLDFATVRRGVEKWHVQYKYLWGDASDSYVNSICSPGADKTAPSRNAG